MREGAVILMFKKPLQSSKEMFEAAFLKRGFILSSLATHALKIWFQNDLLMMKQIALSLNKYLLYTVQF